MKKKFLSLALLSLTLFSFNLYSDSGCCCTSCVCPPGPQGPLGAQGTQGAQGLAGSSGAQGLAGSTGAQGPAGPIGPVGPQGPCCSTTSSPTVAGVYSLLDQDLLPGSPVVFENINLVTPGAFDLTLASTTGEITFFTPGVYSVTWRVSGVLTPPYPDPVPVWSLSLFLDGVAVPGSCFAGFSLFPNLLTANGASNVLITVTAGQVLTLQSSALLPISLISSTPGSSLPAISATISIIKE